MRLFIALELSPQMRASAARALETLRASLGSAAPSFSFARAESLHVTLRFLGQTDPAQLPVLEAAMRRAAAACSPFVLRLAGAGAFPSPRRPRVVWLGVRSDDDALEGLAARLEEELAVAGWPKEERAFRGHLTLARVRPKRKVRPLDELESTLGIDEATTDVSELILFESRLHPKGAQHLPLVRARLGGC